MADFEAIIKTHVGEGGGIPASAIGTLVSAIKQAVGNEFVDKTRYKAKLDEIDELKTKQQTAEDGATTAEKWKTKYEGIKQEFDAYKTEQTNKETKHAKETAYRELLKTAGVSEKRLEAVLKVSNIDGITLADGKVKDADKLVGEIKKEWADFITTTETQGAKPATPPTGNGGMDKEAEMVARVRNAMGLPDPKQDKKE